MKRFVPYGYKESGFRIWSEIDLDQIFRGQKILCIICFTMIVVVVGLFLLVAFQLTLPFLAGMVITSTLTALGLMPLWIYSKKWTNGMKGSYYLRAVSDDDGYLRICAKVNALLDKAGFQYRRVNNSFQEVMGTDWLPKEEIMTLTGPLKVVELSFDVTKKEGLELKLNSLPRFPGLERTLIDGLDDSFSMNPQGIITVRN